MESLYGCSVAAGLRLEAGYDKLAETQGGTASSCASRPSRRTLKPALGGSVAVPALVNVLADPIVAYPRRPNLA